MTEIVNQEKKEFRFSQLDFGTILSKLLKKESVTNINCWYDNIIVSDNEVGKEYRYDFSQNTPEEIEEYRAMIMRLPERLAHRMEKPFTHAEPILDAENAEDDEIGRIRVNAIYTDVVSSDGKYSPAVSIRKTLMKIRINEDNILKTGYASKEILDLFEILIKANCSIAIAGQTNAGKTELLRYVSRHLDGLIITIEDTREAYLRYNYPDKNILEIKSDPSDYSKYIRSCLRQNPNWIMVSESRGEEVIELLKSSATDHSIITTLHSSSAMQIPSRFIEMSNAKGSFAEHITRQAYENIQIGVYIDYQNTSEGSKRRIAEIAEFYMEDNNIKSHMICKYDYATKKYIYEPIKSPKIIEKIIRRDVSTKKIDGVLF